MKNGETVAAFERRARARIRMAKSRALRPDLERERNARWAKAHPDKKRAQRQRWAKANPEKVAAKARRDRLNDPVKFRERGRRYRKTNPDKVKQFAEARRARQAQAPGRGVHALEWREVRDSYLRRCAYCGAKGKMHMDHVDALSVGGSHEIENIAPACSRCNKSKGKWSLLVWLARRAA